MNRYIKAVVSALPPLARLVEQRDQLIKETTEQKSLINKLEAERADIFSNTREIAAARFLSGEGLEIGALHMPLPVPPSAHVKYVDRLSAAELRRHYPELEDKPLVEADILDDGQTLATIADNSVDFVIANHLLEHIEDPIRAILNLVRVLRPDGVLFIAVPDKRFTFDKDRPVTPIEHMIRDFEEGPEWSRRSHFAEWVRFYNSEATPAEQKAKTDELMDIGYSIHYHVWTVDEFHYLLQAAMLRTSGILEPELVMRNGAEVIAIIRKRYPLD